MLRYIDRALAGDLWMFRPSYDRRDAVALDAYSQSKYGADFAALSTRQAGRRPDRHGPEPATGFNPNAKAVFEMIRTHAVQGMFGDPAHGGNTGMVGWKLVRFPGPRLVITARDQQLNVVPRSNMQSAYSMPLFKSTWRGGTRCQRCCSLSTSSSSGSGAAGGTAVWPLANAGLKVVGLEAGPRLTVSDYAFDEIHHGIRDTFGKWKANNEVPTSPKRTRASQRRGRSARPGR